MKDWEKYEIVAAELLERFGEHFGLEKVEGKQHVPGSGTEWEIDAKGICEGGEGFMVVECRRHTTAKQDQEKVGGLAFRVQETGAEGGIYVSPLGFQEGAKKVAAAKNIFEVTLGANSTPHDFMMGFLNKFFLGVTHNMDFGDRVKMAVVKGKPQETEDKD